MSILLPHQGGVLGGVHTSEVKHGHIRLPIMIDGKIQRWQLLLGGEVCCLPGIVQQSLLIHILPGKQELCISIVLSPEREEAR